MSYNHPDWSFKPKAAENPFGFKKNKKHKPSKAQRRKWRAIAKYERLQAKFPDVLSKEFYKSQDWLELRYRVLKHYGGCCMLCGARSGNGIVLHVDHIKPRSKFPRLALDFSNLQVLCESCNLGKSNKDNTDWRYLDIIELLPDGAAEHMKSL